MADANRGPVLRGGVWRLAEPGTVTASGTDVDTYLPGAGFWLTLPPWARGVEIRTTRTADSGTCTMDVFPEAYNQVTEAYTAMRDGASAVLGGVQYANDATGERVLRIHPDPIFADADGVLIVNTTDKWFQATMPRDFRVRVRSGGTTVTNTFSMIVSPIA